MSDSNRVVLAAAAACLLAGPSSALAGSQTTTKLTSAGSAQASSARISGPKAAAARSANSSAKATKSVTASVNLSSGVIYLSRSETRQVGQGGAWVVAGAVGLALAPQTAGVGTIAAIAVGVALGSVGSKLIDAQLAKNQCLKITVPWITLGTTARIGWYGCPA